MKSFKTAEYKPINIFGVEGVYTEDVIDDKLPDGFYKYYYVADGEYTQLTSKKPEKYKAIIITQKPVVMTDKRHFESADICFKDKKFAFNKFFNGYYRPIDFQINAAENARDQQFQDKSRSKSKNVGREEL